MSNMSDMSEIEIDQPIDVDNYDKNYCIVILKFIRLYWKTFFFVIWPFICLIVFFIDVDRKIRCLYVIILMMGYFVTQCLPLSITGLIPIALFPLLAVNTTAEVCSNYMNNTNYLLICVLLISHSISHSGLHYRMAYKAMLIIGCSPRRLLCGISITSVVLSMWLVNMATIAMMCPVIHTILSEYEKHGIGPVFHPKDLEKDSEHDNRRPTNVTKAFFLTVAYSCGIGGTCTLVGSGTNITFKILFERAFPDHKEIDFLRWIQFNSLSVLIITIGMFVSIQIMLMGLFRTQSIEAQFVELGNLKRHEMSTVIKTKLNDLGSITFHEIIVTIMYFLCIIIWITSKPYLFPGWVDIYPYLLKENEIIRLTPVCTGALISFLILTLPAVCNCSKFLTTNKSNRPKTVSPPILPWDIFRHKMCWGLLFMISGGVALADASISTGLAIYLGGKLSILKVLPNILIMIITCILTSILTEFVTAGACANILIPILIEMSIQMHVDPLLFTYPAAICSAWGFMLPVASPINAILIDQTNIRNSNLLRYGLAIKLFSLIVIFLVFPTYGVYVYDIYGYYLMGPN